MSKKITFSIDKGYGHIKWAYYSDKNELKFGKIPNAVYHVTRTGDLINEEDIINYNGESYLVGVEALNYVTVSARTFDQMMDFSHLLIYAAIKDAGLNPEDVETLITGISLVNAKEQNKKGKEIYKKTISQSKKVNGETLKFKNVMMATQGQGIYWEYMKKNMNDDNVIVVDIGMNTLDYLVYLNKRASGEKSDANKYGVNRMTTTLGSYISEKFNIDTPSEQILNKYLLNKQIKFKGVVHDLSDEIDKIAKNYISEVVRELRTKIGDTIFDTVDAIVFSGGGAYYLPEKLDEPHFVLSESPFEFSNARGYLLATDAKFMADIRK